MAIVPDKIFVSYKERDDTYRNKLGFVSYWNVKRDCVHHIEKFKDWIHGWRSKEKPLNFPIDEFDNVLTDGFVLNKLVAGQRSHYGRAKDKVRIYDPRGFEVNITNDNLLDIIEYSDIIGKEIQSKLIYIWGGTEEFYLATEHCEKYTKIVNKNSIAKKTRDEKKAIIDKRKESAINKKDLIKGNLYLNIYNEGIVYVGSDDKYFNEYIKVCNPSDSERFKVGGYFSNYGIKQNIKSKVLYRDMGKANQYFSTLNGKGDMFKDITMVDDKITYLENKDFIDNLIKIGEYDSNKVELHHLVSVERDFRPIHLDNGYISNVFDDFIIKYKNYRFKYIRFVKFGIDITLSVPYVNELDLNIEFYIDDTRFVIDVNENGDFKFIKGDFINFNKLVSESTMFSKALKTREIIINNYK